MAMKEMKIYALDGEIRDFEKWLEDLLASEPKALELYRKGRKDEEKRPQ